LASFKVVFHTIVVVVVPTSSYSFLFFSEFKMSGWVPWMEFERERKMVIDKLYRNFWDRLREKDELEREERRRFFEREQLKQQQQQQQQLEQKSLKNDEETERR